MSNNYKDTPQIFFLTPQDLEKCHYTRSVSLAGSTYYLCIQGLKSVVEGTLVLKSRIHLYERAIDAEDPTLIGFLHSGNSINDKNPEMWHSPRFVTVNEADNPKTGANQYYGEHGFNSAVGEILGMTDENILKGLRVFVGKGRTEQKYILMLCIKELISKRTICIYESPELMLFEPPQTYNYDGVKYQLTRSDNEGDCIYSYYFPVGSIIPKSVEAVSNDGK